VPKNFASAFMMKTQLNQQMKTLFIDVVVSFDETWHHRGFKSSQDIGMVISVDTGEIFDAEVVSKTYETCQRSALDKSKSDFETWQQQQHKDGKCPLQF